MAEAAATGRVLRFTVSDRIEHGVQLVAFTGLAISGLVQKFADGGLSDWIIRFFGGIEQTRKIHHVLAATLLLSVVYHLGVLGYKRFVQHRPSALVPGKADLWAALGWVKFNTGLASSPPERRNADPGAPSSRSIRAEAEASLAPRWRRRTGENQGTS